MDAKVNTVRHLATYFQTYNICKELIQTQVGEHGKRTEKAWDVLKDLTDPELPFLTLDDLGVIREIKRTIKTMWLLLLQPTLDAQLFQSLRKKLQVN